MALFSTIFPNVDDSGALTAAREVCALGVGGAAAAAIAKAIGYTAIAVNPLSGFVYCTTAAIVDKTVGDVIRSTLQKYLSPRGSSAVATEARISVVKASDAIAKVVAIALTTFAIGLIFPSLALGSTTGLLTCVASLTLNALFDASIAAIMNR